jgi:hypothetical protein
MICTISSKETIVTFCCQQPSILSIAYQLAQEKKEKKRRINEITMKETKKIIIK